MTLTGTTAPCQSEPRSNGNEGCALHSLKIHDLSLTIGWFFVIYRILVGERYPLQRRSHCILQPQLTGPSISIWFVCMKHWCLYTVFDRNICILQSPCRVNWGCSINRLLLCRRVRPHPKECSGYDTKQSDGEVPVMQKLWGIRSTPLLPSLPGPLWPGVVAPDKCPNYGLNRTKLCFLHYTDFCI